MAKWLRGSLGFGLVVVGVWLFGQLHEPSIPQVADPEAGSAATASVLETGYVVSGDKRLYVVDLSGYILASQSDPLDIIGIPTALDVDPENGHLFIGSQSDPAGNTRTASLVKTDLSGMPTAIYDNGSIFSVVDFSGQDSPDSSKSVYRVVYSPVREELYVGFADDTEFLSTVLDANSGEVLRRLRAAVLRKHVFSPSASELADIFPSGSKVAEGGERSWNGGIAVLDLNTGEWGPTVDLIDNKGLSPPWGDDADASFFYLRNNNELEVYDTEAGTLKANMDLAQITGLTPVQDYVSPLEKDGLVALSMVGQDEMGYVVVLDVDTKREVARIPVGAGPTNLVLR